MNLIVNVENVNGVLVTTSNRVAEELGVNHKHLLEKINGYVSKFNSAETSAQFYIESEYRTKDGRSARNYLITKKGIAQVIGGYSSRVKTAFDLNMAYINKFEQMERSLNKIITEEHKLVLEVYDGGLGAVEASKKLVELKTAELSNKIEEQKPKVLFANSVETSKDSILIRELAKILKQNGVKIGGNDLYVYLRENGYLIKKGDDYNLPTQKAMNLKLFEIKASTITQADGRVRVTKTTKVTGKGQVYFINKFLNK